MSYLNNTLEAPDNDNDQSYDVIDHRSADRWKLAMQYVDKTEAFDKTICTGMRDGAAVPQSGREISIISKHAVATYGELLHKALQFGTEKEFRDAIKEAMRYREKHPVA